MACEGSAPSRFGVDDFRQVGFAIDLREVAPLHAADGKVHPRQRAGDHHEQQHEAAGPDAGQVIEYTKGNRQDEAAEATNHAHHAAHRADVLRVVHRDVLVHRRLAQ